MSQERDILIAGITDLDLQITDEQLDKLLQFVALIQKWNKAYNLSGVRDSIEMVRLHILDSLAVLPHLKFGSIIDIGTGAGLPGIPLAIVRPDDEFVLLDSNAKKTRFVQQAIVELKLKNATVYQKRVEDFRPERLFETVITRAFASMADIQKLTGHLMTSSGELIAMKGQPTPEELQVISDDFTVIPLNIPGINAERCLIRIRSTAERV